MSDEGKGVMARRTTRRKTIQHRETIEHNSDKTTENRLVTLMRERRETGRIGQLCGKVLQTSS